MNGFEVQSEADAMMERQKRDILPGISTPKTPSTPRFNRYIMLTLPDTVGLQNL